MQSPVNSNTEPDPRPPLIQPACLAERPAARDEVQGSIANAVRTYAKFCQVTGTPEELNLDFGLNSRPPTVPGEPMAIDARVTLNYFTAKRMMAALYVSLQRFEANFGVLETDVQKRLSTKPNS